MSSPSRHSTTPWGTNTMSAPRLVATFAIFAFALASTNA